jgi:hypothetical protein
MPFNPGTGVYTPPNGAENAFAGQIIASATWNAIFTDISAALTQLAQGLVTVAPRTITAIGSFAINTTDTLVLVQASTPTITLPASATKASAVTIVGNASGIFSSRHAVVVPNGGELIDGLSTVTLQNDYQSITLVPLAAGGWVVTG